MKVIRYLLSHALLLAFFLALGFAYYNRAQLFSDDINAKIDSTVHGIVARVRSFPEQPEPVTQTSESNQPESNQVVASETTAPETVAQKEEIQETTVSADQTSEVAQSSESDVKPAQTEPVTSLPVDEIVVDSVSVTGQQQEVVTQTTVEDSVTENAGIESTGEATEQTVETASPAEPVLSDAEGTPETVVAQTMEATDSVPAAEQEQTPTVSTDKEAVTKSNVELLNQARLAFQSGDSNKAVTLYQELSDLNPDDPNTYGELGNVLYSQGRWQQAGQAYYEAATRLLQQGQIEQVQYLHRVIHGLDRESADKLRSQMGR